MKSDLEKLKEEFFYDLENKDESYVVSKWIVDRTPYIFQNDFDKYLMWKEVFSNKIGVDGRAMCITGSACTGFSLNPDKNYKLFNKESDVDVAIVSNHYFDISWHYLRNMGSKRYSLTLKQKESVNDHVSRLIYWGTIATDKILSILPFGKEWLLHLNEMAKENLTLERDIKVRIYKDYESLRAYHKNNITKLKNQYLEIKYKQEVLR